MALVLEPINLAAYRIRIGRDSVEIGDSTAASVKGWLKYCRNRGTWFRLSKSGTPSGLATVDAVNAKIRIPYGNETVEITAHEPDVEFPDGRAEFNVILNSQPTPDANGDYWQVLDFETSGFNMGRVLGLDEEYDQAKCVEDWGEDYGTGTYTITPTQIIAPDGTTVLKTKAEHLVHSLLGKAIQVNHDKSVLGKNPNNGQDITYTRVSRDHLRLPRRLLVDDSGKTARIEDIKIVGNQIHFKLPKAFIEAGSTRYPIQHATGTDPAYTQEMEFWTSDNLSADGTWQTVTWGFQASTTVVYEFILSNATTGTENTMGVRAVGSSLSRYVTLHEAEGGGQTHCRMFVQSDSNGDYQAYHSDISDSDAFYTVGYWENVSFTELWVGYSGAIGSWTDWQPTGYSANRVAHFLFGVTSETAYTCGIRTNGSSLERKLLVHEAEAGGSNYLDALAKFDGSGYVEAYAGGAATIIIVSGYFSSELDFVEKWEALDITSWGGWSTFDLTSYLDQDGRMCDFLVAHVQQANVVTMGVRDGDDSSTLRYLVEHEAESAGSGGEATGFGMSAKSNSSGEIKAYYATSGEWLEALYLTGYFKPVSAGTTAYKDTATRFKLWATSFKDTSARFVVVKAPVPPWSDDFSSYTEGSPPYPVWAKENYGTTPSQTVESGELCMHGATSSDEPISYLVGYNQSAGYLASVKMKWLDNLRGLGIMSPKFYNVNNKYEVTVDPEYTSITLAKCVGGSWSQITSVYMSDLAPMSIGTWYTVKCYVKYETGTHRFIVSVNDKVYINTTDSDLNFTGFALIAYLDDNTYHIHFDDVKLTPVVNKDIATRFKLSTANVAYIDTATRFKLGATAYKDVVTRFQTANSIAFEQLLNNDSWDMYSGSITRVSQVIESFPASTVVKFSAYLSKLGSPTGIVYARLRRKSDDAIIGELGSVNAASVQTNTWYDFNLPVTNPSYQDVRFCVEYSGGNTDNRIKVYTYTTDVCWGYVSTYAGFWSNYTSQDMTFKVTYTNYTIAHKDVATRHRLWAQNWQDIASRVKVNVQAYQDTKTRFLVIVGAYKDISTRAKVTVQAFVDTATRFFLQVGAETFKDVASRFKLGVGGFVDTSTRTKVIAQGYTDPATRLNLTVQGYKDALTRFKVTVQTYADTGVRFKVGIGAYLDTATRVKAIAQAYTDTATRFKVLVGTIAYRDVATRFKVGVQAYSDVGTRFKVTIQAYRDTATRFKVIAQSYRDVGTRFLLWGVTTQAASGIGVSSATLHGTLISPDGVNATIRGFEWGTVSGVYTDSWTEEGSFAAGAYSKQITGLPEDTTIYYRAKASRG